MKQCSIYGLLCPISNKIRYIGKTTKSLKHRLINHKSDLRVAVRDDNVKNHRLRWLRKIMDIGLLDKLKIICLESCNQNELSDKEKYWIKKYKNEGYKLTNRSDGGSADFIFFTMDHKNNISGGLKKYFKKYPPSTGKDHHSSIPIIVYNIKNNNIKKFYSIRLCAEEFGISDKLIAYLMKFNRIWNNLIFIHKSKFNGNVNIDEYKKYKGNPDNYISITAYNINMKEKISFKSCSDCAKNFSISKSTICKYRDNKIIYNGWIFYIGDKLNIEEYEYLNIKPSNTKKMLLYDTIKNEEITFGSNADCADFLGISKSAMCMAIKRCNNLYRNRYLFEITKS